jgi:hypothetical protein
MMSATPGPWRVGRNCHSVYSIETGQLIADVRCNIWNNSRAIAAVPELLQRLKEARSAIASLPTTALGIGQDASTHWPIRDELLSNIDATIAKAEGTQ